MTKIKKEKVKKNVEMHSRENVIIEISLATIFSSVVVFSSSLV